MDNKFKESIESMAKEIRAQAQNMKVDTFLSYLYTADIINRYLYMVLADKQVSRAGFTILHFLILNDGSMIPTEISKKTLRSKYSVTRAIDTLEKQGLVERLPIGGDRRNRRVNLTRKGLKAVKNATIDSRERISQDIFRTMGENRLQELNSILKQLRKHVLSLIAEMSEE
jgi:DNA-binding MarR family transcriptional regulator